MANLKDIVSFCNDLLKVNTIEDYPKAYNGLQFENFCEIAKIGCAVDANLITIGKAIEEKVDLMIVHHGMLWGENLRKRHNGAKSNIRQP